jgi:hypothetical protein
MIHGQQKYQTNQFCVRFLEEFFPPRSWNKKFGTGRSRENLCRSKNNVQSFSVISQYKLCQNSRRTISVCSCVHCAKGKKGRRQFIFHLLSLISGIESNMLLIVLLGLIGKFTWVSGYCNVNTKSVKNFSWNKVGIIVLTRHLKTTDLGFPLLYIYNLWFHYRILNNAYRN